jgi:hypothetical protein
MKLTAPRETKPGETFEVYPPFGANWNLHDNTITDCLTPVLLDCYGGESSCFSRNILNRTSATGIKQALQVRGHFDLIDNLLCGFDEPNAVALMLYPDRFGKPVNNLVRGNVFQRCSNAVGQSQSGLWQACSRDGNSFLQCAKTPTPNF